MKTQKARIRIHGQTVFWCGAEPGYIDGLDNISPVNALNDIIFAIAKQDPPSENTNNSTWRLQYYI